MKYDLEMEGNPALPGSQEQDRGEGDSRTGSSVVCAMLMPHAPILVPQVGKGREETSTATCRAMRIAAASLLEHHPDRLVVVSPHSPRRLRAFGIWAENPIEGSFAVFDAPESRVCLPLDREFIRELEKEAKSRGLESWEIHHGPLDHGALVPLWFMAEAGWTGPTTILGLSVSGNEEGRDLGGVIGAAAMKSGTRVAIIASGDMSHRLKPDAPCGFHPHAHQFDEEFIRVLRTGDLRKIQEIDQDLRDLAAEDVVDSTVVAASAVGWKSSGHKVLSYEGPFGVGYGVALLFSGNGQKTSPDREKSGGEVEDGNQLPEVARHSVELALSGSRERPPCPGSEYLRGRNGVFVTIRDRGGQLRGCVGTIEATAPDILVETWRNARLAALQNHRFSPVSAGEIGDLCFEVSVIHPPEEVSTEAELDPRLYGIIVSARDGRRGVLLPGIEEIGTAEQQVKYARAKGGITSGEPVTIQRFQVDHFKEAP